MHGISCSHFHVIFCAFLYAPLVLGHVKINLVVGPWCNTHISNDRVYPGEKCEECVVAGYVGASRPFDKADSTQLKYYFYSSLTSVDTLARKCHSRGNTMRKVPVSSRNCPDRFLHFGLFVRSFVALAISRRATYAAYVFLRFYEIIFVIYEN